MKATTRLFLIVLLLVIGLDQVTKQWIAHNIELWRGSIEVIPGFFQLVHYRNKGAVGGIFGDSAYRLHLFLAFTVVALGAIGWMVHKLESGERFVAVVLGMIAGGAVGNAIDRVVYHEVIDFLRFYTEHPGVAGFLRQNVGTAEYPSFNVADMGITIGVGAFFIQQFFQDRNAREHELSKDDLPVEEPA